jgi:tetratricopeptide (TPR) repeat protein
VESFRELAAGHEGGMVNAEDYLRRTAALRLDVLRDELAMGRYRNVLVMLSPEHRAKFPPEADFYLGEAYRLRGGEGDGEQAFAAYTSACTRAPRFPPPHRALGVHYLKQADYPRAIRFLEEYLRLAPGAEDRSYVKQYLGIAKKRMTTP